MGLCRRTNVRIFQSGERLSDPDPEVVCIHHRNTILPVCVFCVGVFGVVVCVCVYKKNVKERERERERKEKKTIPEGSSEEILPQTIHASFET